MFKVGDRVKLKQNFDTDWIRESGIKQGQIYTVKEIDYDGTLRFIEQTTTKWQGPEHYELVKGKRGRPAKAKDPIVKFLLKYDLDEDPIEEFESMQQVNKRIKELLQRSDLKRDSMVIYSVKSKKKVAIEPRIVIK